MEKKTDNKEEVKLYSFDEILKMSFVQTGEKIFKKTDTDEILGIVYAKYPKNSKMDAMINGGIIEFVNFYTNKHTKLYGNQVDTKSNIFEVIN